MPKKKELYKATLIYYGKKYTAQGDSVLDAISNINVTGMARDKVILTIEKGKKSKERVLLPSMVNRLFSASMTTRELALKNTSLLFDL